MLMRSKALYSDGAWCYARVEYSVILPAGYGSKGKTGKEEQAMGYKEARKTGETNFDLNGSQLLVQ